MKTYSRLKRASYLSSEPPTKRRRILDDDAVSPSSDAALLHSDAACSPPRTSPPRQTALLSSTPPSSPPPPIQVTTDPTSPLPLPKRKTTFSFFARREAAAAKTATTTITTKPSPQPLAEQRNANNAQASSPSSSPAMPTAAPSEKSNGKGKANRHQPQRRLTQLQLDLGVTPVQRTCKTCGMAYVPSNAEDAALHKRFHAMNVGGVDVGKGFFLSRSGDRGGGGKVVWEKGVDGDFVVVVGRREKAAAKTRVRKVLEVVERELGAVEIPEDELWGQVVVEGAVGGKGARKEEGTRHGQKPGVDGGVEPKPQRAAKVNGSSRNRARAEAATRVDRFKAYLYIRGPKCIGLCLAEHITEAHCVVAASDDGSNPSNSTAVTRTEAPGDQKDSDTTQPHTDTPSNHHFTTTTPIPTHGTLTTSPTTHPTDLGISRIWVSSSHRRHGIAIALLDAAARDFCAYRCEEYDANGDENGKRLPKERIAFSQPTDDGARLARKWFRAETGWGVYW